MVIRGGWGLYYEAGNGNEAQTEGVEGNPPINLSNTTTNVIGYDQIVPGLYAPIGYNVVNNDQKWPTVQQFSLSVQRQLPGDNVVTIAYVGAMGRHLCRTRNINQLPVGMGTVKVPELAGKSSLAVSCSSREPSSLRPARM